MTEISDKKIFYSTTGKNIKKYRELRNYSLQMLAEKVGLTKKTIQRYENGEIKIDMNRLMDLATALDVSVRMLTEGTNIFFGNEMEDDAKTPDSNEREFNKTLSEIKKLTDDLKMDLNDPKTLDTIKRALDLIKSAKTE